MSATNSREAEQMQLMTGSVEDEAVDLGLISEEVVLRLGRPDAVPSQEWTPGLAALGSSQRATTIAASDRRLIAAGWLDEQGRPAGPLAPLAALVRGTEVVVRFETVAGAQDEAPTGSGAFLTSGRRVMLLVHVPASRGYAVQVLAPSVAVAALALGLDPFGLAVACDPQSFDVPGAGLAEVVPASARRSTVRLMRVEVRDGQQRESALTIVGQRDGVLACGALPAGAVRVQRLDTAGLVDLAVAVLGGPAGTRR